jgi:hypothetical protein
LAHSDAQVSVDRRRRPTPRFGYYSFFGRRRDDRYSAPTFFFLVSITGLNILDSLFTMMIMDMGGREVNPIVKAAMDAHGDNFWVWKFAMVSACLILLCLHSRYLLAKRMMVFLTSVYLAVIGYQVYLIRFG